MNTLLGTITYHQARHFSVDDFPAFHFGGIWTSFPGGMACATWKNILEVLFGLQPMPAAKKHLEHPFPVKRKFFMFFLVVMIS